MDYVVANVYFLNLQDAGVRVATHPSNCLVDLGKRHGLFSADCLAKFGRARRFLTHMAREAVLVTCHLRLENLIMIHHVLLVAFSDEIFIGKNEK